MTDPSVVDPHGPARAPAPDEQPRGPSPERGEGTATPTSAEPGEGIVAPNGAPTGEAEAAPVAPTHTGPAREAISRTSSTRRRRQRVQLRTSVTLVLFAIGVAVGAGAAFAATSTPPADPQPRASVPSLALVAEPPAAAAVAEQLARNDLRAMSETLPPPVLAGIAQQIGSLAVVERVRFTNATEAAGQTLAAYVVEGRNPNGIPDVVGLVLIVRDGMVVTQ